MSLIKITDDRFAAEVLESEQPVLVDFWAAWCQPCRKMDRVLAEIAEERDDLRIVKLDVETEQRTGAQYGVLAMPTLMLFSGGREVLRLVGAGPGTGCWPSSVRSRSRRCGARRSCCPRAAVPSARSRTSSASAPASARSRSSSPTTRGCSASLPAAGSG